MTGAVNLSEVKTLTEAGQNIKNFAERVDALAEEVIERLQIERILEQQKVAPILKMMGIDVNMMQIRTMCYQLAMKYPKEVLRFLDWLQDRVYQVYIRTNECDFDEK